MVTVDTAPSPAPGRFVGRAISVSISALVAVPVLQTTQVGSLSRAVPALVAVLAVVSLILRGWRPPSWAPICLIGTYFGVVIVSTYRADDPSGPTHAQLHLLIGASVLVMAMLANESERSFIIRSVIVLASIEGAFAIYEALAQPTPLWGYSTFSAGGVPVQVDSQIFANVARAQGSLGQPLVLAFLLLAGLGLVIGFRPMTSALLYWSIVAAIVGGLIATGSRSGLAVAAILLLFSKHRAAGRWVVGLYLSCLALALLTLFGFWESDVVNRFFASNSLSHRTSSWGSVSSLLSQQRLTQVLFGNGFSSTRRLYDTGILPNSNGFYAVDNQFVSTLAELGLVGLVAIVGVIVWTVLRGDRRFVWAILGALAMFWSFEVLLWPSSYAILLVLLGLAAPRNFRLDRNGAQVRQHMAVG
jgi:uncharacterized membrane protein